MLHLWEQFIRLSEEERQIIQIEIGNGAGIRAIGALLGRSASAEAFVDELSDLQA